MTDVIRLKANDNVSVAARPLAAGRPVRGATPDVTARADIPMGHKIATRRIGAGEPVIKYGETIGFATRPIAPGDWVHTHNLSADEFERTHRVGAEIPPPPEPVVDATFQGYRRTDGRAGTRNYVAVISTVNCSASVSKFVAQRFDSDELADYPNVDGVFALTHSGGCGMTFDGRDHQTLNRVLGGVARHPNVGAYLLIGLGCEQGAMGHLIDGERLVQIDGAGNSPAPAPPPTLVMQDQGGTERTVAEACRKVHELAARANDCRREAIPAAELTLATECGGSDGYSGITANPAVGVASDRLVAAGGTTILAETSEIYGAEQLLTRRARTPQVAERLLERIAWWKWYTGVWGATLDGNPSPGNKAGGLTTIYEKSLGAVAKAGSTALEAVYQYAEPVTAKGLVVMDTPGYDPASVTGMVAGGATIVAFTTGRGSCFGAKPVPTIKIASNTPMYERMIDDMDLDAGVILSGTSVGEVGRRIFAEILAVASGKPTKSERLGYGDEEFVPWTVGPML